VYLVMFMNYYNEIKEKLIKSEIYDKIKDYSKDRNKVKVYYETGKLLSEAGKEYGKNIIKQYSEKLMIEVGNKYNERTLRRIRQFYETFYNEKWSTSWTKLCWSHFREVLSQLGYVFTYIGNEYKIKLDNRYNYIDLLLFNIEYNCYVVVELKVTELKKEHVGQIQIYMNYIDENLRKFGQDKTIGIIICKQNNQYVIKYCSDDRIIAREYELVWYNILKQGE